MSLLYAPYEAFDSFIGAFSATVIPQILEDSLGRQAAGKLLFYLLAVGFTGALSAGFPGGRNGPF
jgi:hypothetical protein